MLKNSMVLKLSVISFYFAIYSLLADFGISYSELDNSNFQEMHSSRKLIIACLIMNDTFHECVATRRRHANS